MSMGQSVTWLKTKARTSAYQAQWHIRRVYHISWWWSAHLGSHWLRNWYWYGWIWIKYKSAMTHTVGLRKRVADESVDGGRQWLKTVHRFIRWHKRDNTESIGEQGQASVALNSPTPNRESYHRFIRWCTLLALDHSVLLEKCNGYAVANSWSWGYKYHNALCWRCKCVSIFVWTRKQTSPPL
jgi:hypothetical protein